MRQECNRARQPVSLAELFEQKRASAFGNQLSGKWRPGREHRRHPVAEFERLLKIIGLKIGEHLLIGVARLLRLRHLKAEEGGAFVRLRGHDEYGQRWCE